MTRFHCSAILFDLDGVLVDSTQSIVAVWTAWARKNNLNPEAVMAVIHGRRTLEALRLLAPHLDGETEAHEIEAGITHSGTVAIAGAARLLKSLPVDRWCVVTSGMGEFARARLQAATLPVPPVLVSADEVTKGKPHPEPYLKGAQLLGVEPAACVVIEDALNGIQAGRAAGMKVIGVATTYPASELIEADAVVETLESVTATVGSGQISLHLDH
jgi:mannitol-1-/sugar-/sorbitol-6-phosphatase